MFLYVKKWYKLGENTLKVQKFINMTGRQITAGEYDKKVCHNMIGDIFDGKIHKNLIINNVIPTKNIGR